MVRTKFHLTRQRLRRRFSKSQIQPHIHPEKDLSMASYEVCPRKVPINIHQMQVSQITLMLVVGENWLKACRRFVRAKIGGQRFNLHLAAHTRASDFFFSPSAFFSAARRLIASIVSPLCGIAIVSTLPVLLHQWGQSLENPYILITTSLSASLLRRRRQHIAGIDIQCSSIRCIER